MNVCCQPVIDIEVCLDGDNELLLQFVMTSVTALE